ncbi:OmpA family protein [Robertkochia sediminum]|uniref:hypothetical protein n=1 Tax=Robertkochia sediminum TaxID=2785326 RepID=UPI001931BF0F|nr:hypothetical protein [Robertkochia sediminum]MBL7471382.1 hypothetical protein [Robertkochia sediminum]
MSRKKSGDLFWMSYSDLMTSMFFVMLVLFVLVFSIMKYEQHRLQIKLQEFEKLEEIKAALNNLDKRYFEYDSINKRHELVVDVLFRSGSSIIPEKSKEDLYQAGLELKRLIDNVPVKHKDIKYLVIIEGMAARYNNPSEQWKNEDPGYIQRTYILSYNRAKALYEFWESRGIDFGEDTFEIMLAGSGWFGAGRYMGDDEGKNKRFLIQILPKVGQIGKT